MTKIILLAVVFLFSLALGLWLLLGRGPRRHRVFRQAQRLLERGNWKEALDILATLNEESRLSPVWRERLRAIVGECHQLAADQLLKEKQFEEALRHSLDAAARLGLDLAEQRGNIVGSMLAEVRHLFALGTERFHAERGNEAVSDVLNLLDRIFTVQTPCAEASFWQGLCLIRQQQIEAALAALTAAHEQVGRPSAERGKETAIDPAFYLALLLYRQGKAQESLRYLAEANRIDSGCPFVICQMGISLVAAGSDSGLAVRALQRALGPRGFAMWTARPDRAWVEAFPEGKSYVRRLASKYAYICPVLGPDLTILLRQGQFALAQAHYQHGDFPESADLFAKLLQDSPPTVPLLRGLGLALARCERYDQAYKHLRIALEQQERSPPENGDEIAFTAGYLALCGAMGKPTNPDDKPRNVAWAIRLMARYTPPLSPPGTGGDKGGGHAEWAGLLSAVHAEARQLNMAVGVDEQLQLCDVLASVNATDAQAAESYAHLASTYPEALQSKHAFLYVRAATLRRARSVSDGHAPVDYASGSSVSDHDLDLFERTFKEEGAARAFFAEQQWNFDDAEYAYLERGAALHPGQFPSVLGADYPARGEAFLLKRSHHEEEHSRAERGNEKFDYAIKPCEVLLRLAPTSIRAHDRLACLHYRRGDRDHAVALLAGWHRLAPNDPCPLVRQAILEQQRGRPERRAEAIDRALGLTHGPSRAAVAFLGARLALRESFGGKVAASVNEQLSEPLPNGRGSDHSPLALAQTLLETCLREEPNHTEALWCLAAVRSVRGDGEGLARQAPEMDRPTVNDARFHYLGAVCNLAAKKFDAVLELSRRAATDEALAIESQFLMAWAYLHQGNLTAAQQTLQKVAVVETSPSSVYARALLGRLHLIRGDYDEASKWWSSVAPARRNEWRLDEPLRRTVLLSGLIAYQNERFEQAADRFREAGKLGLRDRNLGPLLTLALARAGQRLLYDSTIF
ncbi:MAG: tetratricopeptide repeat protein [Gemmataceae bacterium]